MPRKDGHGRRIKAHTPVPEDPAYEKAPKSLVFTRGTVSANVAQFCYDLRETYLPHTSRKLKVKKRDRVLGLARAAKSLGVTHLQIVTCAATGTFLRMARVPHGPTIQFRVESFETSYDVKKTQRRPYQAPHAFDTPALPVLNNFVNSTKPHIKMAQTMLTNLYPQLRVDKVRLVDCRRIMLFHLNEESEMIDVRHYLITGHRPTKNKMVKHLERGCLPKRAGALKDVSDLLTQPEAMLSDSDGEAEELELGQRFRRLDANSKALIKLVELGPRMTLSIHKIMAGMLDGEVIYHSLITKSTEEIEELRRRRKRREQERKARRDAQERRVEEKRLRRDEKKRRREQRRLMGQDSDAESVDSAAQSDDGPQAKSQKPKGEHARQEGPGGANLDATQQKSFKKRRFERMKGTPDDVTEVMHSNSAALGKPGDHGFQSAETMFPRGEGGEVAKDEVEQSILRNPLDRTRNRSWQERQRRRENKKRRIGT